MRSIRAIQGNTQRLDGGAMFGNAPKAVWQSWIAPDEQNRIPLACRAMLVEDGARKLLFETGIGAFFEPKLKERFGVVEAEHVLVESLAAAGSPHDAIDVVVLSHLHFDHAGGLLAAWAKGRAPELLFPKATFVVSEEAWDRALHPHARDRASFIPELQTLLEASGRLRVVDGKDASFLGEGFRFHLSHGHTPGLLLTEVLVDGRPTVFAGDLVPGAAWVHAPITMGYDRYPELLIDEKRALLTDLVARNGSLFFTHDPTIAISRIAQDERGRFVATGA